jgi:hypothetical protein
LCAGGLRRLGAAREYNCHIRTAMRRDRWHFGSSVAAARFNEANRAFHVVAA